MKLNIEQISLSNYNKNNMNDIQKTRLAIAHRVPPPYTRRTLQLHQPISRTSSAQSTTSSSSSTAAAAVSSSAIPGPSLIASKASMIYSKLPQQQEPKCTINFIPTSNTIQTSLNNLPTTKLNQAFNKTSQLPNTLLHQKPVTITPTLVMQPLQIQKLSLQPSLQQQQQQQQQQTEQLNKTETKCNAEVNDEQIKPNEPMYVNLSSSSSVKYSELARSSCSSVNSSLPNSAKTSPERFSSVGSSSDRDFLIDDEISDQPELVLSASIAEKCETQMRTSMSSSFGFSENELPLFSPISSHPRLSRKQSLNEATTPTSPSSTSTPSSTTAPSINSSPSTVISTAINFRKPRALSVIESADGSFGFDNSSYRHLQQDMNGIKTLLFRLQGLLQNAETQNPFESNRNSISFMEASKHNLETSSSSNEQLEYQLDNDQSIVNHNNNNNNNNNTDDNNEHLVKENAELKRQLAILSQQNEEKSRVIKLLQQQMTKYMRIEQGNELDLVNETMNTATQTDRDFGISSNGISPRAVSDGSDGMLISDIDKLVNGDSLPCLEDQQQQQQHHHQHHSHRHHHHHHQSHHR